MNLFQMVGSDEEGNRLQLLSKSDEGWTCNTTTESEGSADKNYVTQRSWPNLLLE